MRTIVLLSGPMAVGKTQVTEALVGKHGFRLLRSSGYLKELCRERQLSISRAALQALGDQLDEQTGYTWLVDAVARPQLRSEPEQRRWLIDSVRKPGQIEHFRSAFAASVLHVHLWAPEDVPRERYQRRLVAGSHSEGKTPYEDATTHPNEISARGLRAIADITMNLAVLESDAAAKVIFVVTGGEQ